MSSGERVPLLVDGRTGMPLFDPTVYVLTEVRSRNASLSTLDSHLRAILALQLFADARGIDLSGRAREGRLLELSEIESLVRLCRLRLDEYSARLEAESTPGALRVTSLESVRQRMQSTHRSEVDPATAATRIRAIRDYMDWLAFRHLAKLPAGSALRSALDAARAQNHAALSARAPKKRSRNDVGQREGMSPDERKRLLQVISPDASENPFLSQFSRFRNELAIHLLLVLGIRRGELLGLKIGDFDFQKQTVLIARRADDPDDPRVRQPLTKTMSRRLALPADLCARIQHYVLNVRRKAVGARRHDFLLVAARTGEPLSLDSLNKMFRVVREKTSGLPAGFSPHVLRHTWNDVFSEVCDKGGVAAADEEYMRKYAMGWSRNSTAPETYLRRHVREKTNSVLYDMQDRLLGSESKKKECGDE